MTITVDNLRRRVGPGSYWHRGWVRGLIRARVSISNVRCAPSPTTRVGGEGFGSPALNWGHITR